MRYGTFEVSPEQLSKLSSSELQSFAPMPFLPSSPTRLYSRHKVKRASLLSSKVTEALPDIVGKGMESAESPSSRSSSQPLAVDDSAAMAVCEETSRKSLSSLKGAFLERNTNKDRVLDAVSDSGRKSPRSATITTALSSVDSFVSDSLPARMNDSDVPADARSERSPIASSLRDAFSDNTSELEYCIEEDTRLVVGRASSVRVSKPQIVQHKPTKLSKPHDCSKSHSRSDSHSSLKAEKKLGHRSEKLPSTPEESELRDCSGRAAPVILEGFEVEQAAASRGSSRTITPPSSESNKDGEGASSTASVERAKTPPSANTLHSIRLSIVSPQGSLDSGRASQQTFEPAPLQALERTMSSPLPLPGKGLSRRVTIRPADLIINNHNIHNSFRESIVTTPYPPRMSTDTSSMDFEEKDEKRKAQKSKKLKGKETQQLSFPYVANEASLRGAKDRFPSPERPEVLFIDLNLFSHPTICTTIEIQIADKGTFDDELFFQQIRIAYRKQLLGLRRLAFTLVRRICQVSVTAPANHNPAEFDSIDFVKHFQNPRLGRKRKVWVIWLRSKSPRSAAPAVAITHTNGTPVRQIDNLHRLSLRTRLPGHSQRLTVNKSHNTNKDIDTTKEDKRLSTTSDASSFHFVYSPAVPWLPSLSCNGGPTPALNPISPTANVAVDSPCRSFFWPSNLSSSSASRSGNTAEGEAVRLVTISFHHEFRAVAIALLTLFVVFQAVLASVIWIIFGVPGTRPGMDGPQETVGSLAMINTDWRVDSRSRVLTGVVIGLVVLVIGGLIEGALVWGSWLLL